MHSSDAALPAVLCLLLLAAGGALTVLLAAWASAGQCAKDDPDGTEQPLVAFAWRLDAWGVWCYAASAFSATSGRRLAGRKLLVQGEGAKSGAIAPGWLRSPTVTGARIQSDPYGSGAYACGAPGYTCDYYDYGVTVEGTGQLGILANVLLDQINRLAQLTPRLGARARVDTVVSGQQTASRRNTTVVVQNRPSRSAGLYTGGGTATDPTQSAALSAGTSSAVGKNIVSTGFPVNNYGSSGQTFALVNASSDNPNQASAVRALSGGLATAGARAIVTTTGQFAVGPVVGIFNAGDRAGAASQNGVASQTIGTQSATYLQSASLGAVSPGSPKIAGKDIAAQQKALAGLGGGVPDEDGLGIQLQEPTDVVERYLDLYYGDEDDKDAKPKIIMSAGSATKAWMIHQDLLPQPSTRPTSTRATLNTFGAANGYGWGRGLAVSDLLSSGTRSAGARLRSGAFGTGASTTSANVAAVTDLPDVIKCKPAVDKEGIKGHDSADGQDDGCPRDAKAQGDKRTAVAGQGDPHFANAFPTAASATDGDEGGDDLLTPELRARLDGPLGFALP